MGKDQDLLEAARSGNVAVVEKILGQRAKRSGPLASLRRGPGANVQDSSGYSSLHHAALNGHRDIVRLLLEHDASTNIVDNKGSTPLHLASWSGNHDIVRLVLSGHGVCNVNLTNKDDETALHCASQYGHTAVVCLLLEHNCDPGIRNNRGETALDLAAQYGRLETVELLVRAHPSLIHHMQRIIPGTVFPHTPLHLASRNGHRSVVEVLLRSGLDVNIRTPAGTALHEAALCGKVEVVKSLLEHGVDLHIRDAHNYSVRDLLSQFPAHATQEITGLLKNSDGESFTQPFPPVHTMDSDLGSPYENVRPCSRGRSMTTDPSPGSSPHRWGDFRHARSMDAVEDRRISGTSILRGKLYTSLPPTRRKRPPTTKSHELHNNTTTNTTTNKPNNTTTVPRKPFRGIAFSFSKLLHELGVGNAQQRASFHTTTSSESYRTASDCSRESDNASLYHFPGVPKQFMDSTALAADDAAAAGVQYMPAPTRGPDLDRVSLSSTASSTSYPRRPDSGGAPHYMPMRGPIHSPGSHSKVSPTPPKKPPRRNLSVSPTHLQHMSASADAYSNNAYEMLFLAHSGTRSQSNLTDLEAQDSNSRRERLAHGRSVDQYVEMNTVFSINLDEEEEEIIATTADDKRRGELLRGKSEDLDCIRPKHEPVAITSVYENMVVKQQNPRRKLRRNQDAYEEYEVPTKGGGLSKSCCSSAPESRFVSSAFIMIKDDYAQDEHSTNTIRKSHYTPLSPTHYKQPPTPDHPPPSAVQAENFIHDRMRPLSQEYKRRSKDMETETEDEYLFVYEGSSGSFSSSVSLSDKSTDYVEEYHSDAPFAGLIKGSTRHLNKTPAERPKTLKKLKRVYDNVDNSSKNTDSQKSSSSGSDKESDNKENKDRMCTLSPFDEQEEWAKIQEIMASFGTGLVRESVFVSELEKEFQSRLLSIGSSQNSLVSTEDNNVEKWLQSLEMLDYSGLFVMNGFDDLDYLNGVLDDADLKEMGISSDKERQIILDAIKKLPFKLNQNSHCNNNLNELNDSVASWLKRIRLVQYADTFAKHLYHDMERIRRIWDVELSAVLDIEKVGHRKRILGSVSSGEHVSSGPKMEEINADLSVLKNNIHQLKSEMRSPVIQCGANNTGTIRHRHKKSRPAPQPPVAQTVTSATGGENTTTTSSTTPSTSSNTSTTITTNTNTNTNTTTTTTTNTNSSCSKKEETNVLSELSVGGNNSIKSQWRHQPMLLITGVIKYSVYYLGSTLVKEFKGTESTKKSIQKIRKSSDSTKKEIILTISYRSLKYINTDNQIICEHEIKNVNSACQDPELRYFFAYITKDLEDYYCHVFSTETAEHATDIILTLGQAYELAYQMALREQVTSKSKHNHNHKTSSQQHHILNVAAAVSPNSHASRDFKDSSKADLKLNGHPLKMMPLTLSIAAEPNILETSQHHHLVAAAAAATQRTPTKSNFNSDIEA